MSYTQRLIIKTDTNAFDPTVYSNADGPRVLRGLADLIDRGAQGACGINVKMACKPVYALATVTTTNGSETNSDSLTIGNHALTFVSGTPSGDQAKIAAGTAGTSTSGASPALTATNLSFYVNVNGDGAQLITVDDRGTHTGAAVAARIQALIRALTPINALNAVAFSSATCAYSATYVITSGVSGSNSSVVVTGAGAATLKLGVFNGGVEAVGTATTLNNAVAKIDSSSTWTGICTAYACGNILTLTAAIPGTIGNGLALAVSTTGAVMSITHAWGAATAGTEGSAATFSIGL